MKIRGVLLSLLLFVGLAFGTVSMAQAAESTAPEAQFGPTFFNLRFASGVDANDNPVGVADSLPSGIDELYVFWDWSGMSSNNTFAVDWYLDGEYVPQVSIATSAWPGGPSGANWWAAVFNTPALPDGTYDVELLIDGVVVAAATTTVGGATPPPVVTPTIDLPPVVTPTITPTIDLPPLPPIVTDTVVPTTTTTTDSPFGPIVFASGLNANGQPVNPGTSFSSGIEELYAFWDYSGIEDFTEWSLEWMLDGEVVYGFDDFWYGGPSGTWWESIYYVSGGALPEGTWTVALYVEGELVQTASATIGQVTSTPPVAPPVTPSGPPDGPTVDPFAPSFINLRFAPSVTSSNQPTVVVTSLPSGSTNIYLVFDYSNMQDGLQYEARWYYNGEYVPGMSWGPVAWSGGPSGTWWNGVQNPDGLVDGNYAVELYVEGELFGEASINIGAP